MATGYIVWDSRNKRFVAGPFASSAIATAHIARQKVDGSMTARTSKDNQAQFTVETVTVQVGVAKEGSPVANHADQPKNCDRCGKPVLKKNGGWYYYDDTPAKAHFSRHLYCMRAA